MRKAWFGLILVSLIFMGGSANALGHKPGYLLADSATHPALAGLKQEQSRFFSNQVFLPLAQTASLFQSDLPIWAYASSSAPGEVVLFRHSFALSQAIHSSRLSLFADTRYEVWLDGGWIGRGPARFSQNLREYDVYQLAELAPGEHLIAILAQWAPNNRRSESVTPLLQGHLLGFTPAGERVIEPTGPHWKALLSDAWRQDAAPVHTWELIGPTELLDFRRLPADWNQPGFQDEAWPQAAGKDPRQVDYLPLQVPRLGSTPPEAEFSPKDRQEPRIPENRSSAASYTPRTISFLESAPITPTLIDAGRLSPGRSMVELTPAHGDPYSLTLHASAQTVFSIETLSSTLTAPARFQVDGFDIAWQTAGSRRPGVFTASQSLLPGQHLLTVTNIPAQGITFALSDQNLSFHGLPFEQGSHAGRRLLLSEPASDLNQVIVTGTIPLDLEFPFLPAYVVLDVGRTTHGRLAAEANGPPGTIVDIGWDERLDANTHRPLPFPGTLHPQWNQVDSWVMDGTSRFLNTIDTRSGRYILIAIWGQGPVRLKNLRVLEERYPLVQRGDFHSSDPLLERIWDVGVKTASLNMSDAFTDTPWRERGQWWGDAYVIHRVNQVSFGDYSLFRRGLVLMANAFTESGAPGAAPNNNGSHMLDYAMLWVQGLADYSLQTGDTQILSNTYPVLQSFLSHLHSLENVQTGLIELPQDHWWLTAYIELYGYHSRYGQSTAVNALYFKTLQDAAWIAGIVSDSSSQAEWQQKADKVSQAVQLLLYLPSEGRYLTNLYQGAAYPPTPQAQAWALANGLVPAGEKERVAASLIELLSFDPVMPNLDVYGMYWVLSGLGQAGKIGQALEIIETGYGDLLSQGATTWWERLDASKYYWATLSHGWGGAPTWFLSTYLLGLRRVGPDSWQARPAFQAASWASGRLPLEHGGVEISWEHRSCGEIRIELEGMPSSSGELILPNLVPDSELSLDGRVVFRDGQTLVQAAWMSSGEIHLALGDGRHFLVVRQACP